MEYNENVTHIESKLPTTTIYCSKSYDAASKTDVYEMKVSGGIQESGNVLNKNTECQKYLGK